MFHNFGGCIIHNALEIAFQLVFFRRMIQVIDSSFVFQDKFGTVIESPLPGVAGALFFQHTRNLFAEQLVDQRIDVFKIIVECIAVDAAVIHDVLHRDSVKRGGIEQLHKGLHDRGLGELRHS